MMKSRTETAVFGGGCFWCTEAVFRMLKGVVGVVPGYAGGTTKNPTYERVCAGASDHAEVIKIEFDPAVISYEDLLAVFFATHDPTTMNRQGNDVGAQYRSLILYADEAQKIAAEKIIVDVNASSPAGAHIVTQVEPLRDFYEAEEYHKDYYRKNVRAPYCEMIINPKLEKVKKRFVELLYTNFNDRPKNETNTTDKKRQ